MSAESLARAYYRRVNAKDIEGLLALFDDDAQFNLPDGREVKGKDALRSMYENVFAAGGPQPQPVRIVATQTDAAAEVEVTLASGEVLAMASFFTMGSGDGFARVGVYKRDRAAG